MAAIHFQPPDTFDFRKPDEWLRWRKCFEQFRVASGISAESEVHQINTLLYCLGEEAENVLTSTNITDEDWKKYKDMLAKFDSFLKVRKNMTIEQACFNSRCQQEGETSEQYIAALYNLVDTCDYGDLKEDMIKCWHQRQSIVRTLTVGRSPHIREGENSH